MENATKALLIAAGVMIGIIIITIGVYLFARFRNISESYDETIIMQEMAKTNKEFEKYAEEGKNSKITPQEVVAAITTANSINDKYNTDNDKIYDKGLRINRSSSQYAVLINATASGGGKTLNYKSTKADYVEFIKKNLNKTFKCSIDTYKSGPNKGMISAIHFD